MNEGEILVFLRIYGGLNIFEKGAVIWLIVAPTLLVGIDLVSKIQYRQFGVNSAFYLINNDDVESYEWKSEKKLVLKRKNWFSGKVIMFVKSEESKERSYGKN